MPVLAGGLDVAELCLWAFFAFFVGLCVWIRREDRREGYPLEEDADGRILTQGGPWVNDRPKKFVLPFDQGVQYTPTGAGRDSLHMPARRSARFDGAPIEPTGDPLVDGIGPAAWVERMRVPDITAEGHLRIIPINHAHEYVIAREDPDPRGWRVTDLNKQLAGTVSDVWVDQADRLIRYLTVTTNGNRQVLVPMAMLNVNKGKRTIEVTAVTAEQFERAPVLEAPDRITRYEEDRVVAYFGGGHLYATEARQEPIL